MNLGPQEHKKDAVRNKNSLTEIKDDWQKINSIGEAENQISNLKYKEEKTPNQSTKEKKESKNWG